MSVNFHKEYSHAFATLFVPSDACINFSPDDAKTLSPLPYVLICGHRVNLTHEADDFTLIADHDLILKCGNKVEISCGYDSHIICGDDCVITAGDNCSIHCGRGCRILAGDSCSVHYAKTVSITALNRLVAKDTVSSRTYCRTRHNDTVTFTAKKSIVERFSDEASSLIPSYAAWLCQK